MGKRDDGNGAFRVRSGDDSCFDRSSTSLKARNGVGVRADGKVIFGISHAEVSFDAFARLFRDGLNCPQCPVSGRRQRRELVRAVAQSPWQYLAARPDAGCIRQKIEARVGNSQTRTRNPFDYAGGWPSCRWGKRGHVVRIAKNPETCQGRAQYSAPCAGYCGGRARLAASACRAPHSPVRSRKRGGAFPAVRAR
jgi:hypothetical protein